MRSTPDSRSADTQTCARTSYRLELGGGARGIVALVSVVLVEIVVVALILVVGDDGVVIVVVLLPLALGFFLAIIE